nr:MAG TPA: hypothetical protein [Bacteriophage sp.]
MVSTFPVSGSKKVSQCPDFKGFEIWTRLARYLLSDAPSLPPLVEKPRSRIRAPQFEKLRKPSISGAFLYVHFLHIRHLVYEGS